MATCEVDLRVGQPDEMRILVGADPYLSVLTGVYEMLGPGRYMLPRQVVAAADRLARTMDLRPLKPILAPSAQSAGLPHFLLELSGAGYRPLSSALEQLRDTSPDTVAEQVAVNGGRDEGLVGWTTHPRRKLTDFVAALCRFEHAVFRPLVPDFEARLRAQVENMAIAVGTGQGPALLSAIHPHLSRTEDTLRWPSAATAPPILPPVRSMVIYPMLASTQGVLTANESDGVKLRELGLGVTVPALAVRALPDPGSRPPRSSPLTALLGPGRSTVLVTIASGNGHATRSLSTKLRMPPSTVSDHVTALRNAGLIQNVRVGPHVVHRTTIAGRRILTAWD
ncbi:MAG: ArsR/SmtB family transcription factor [Nocardioides sp.]